MGPSFIEAGRMRELKEELADLKATVDFQRRVLEIHADRIADLKAEARDRAKPKVEEFTAADAYRKSIRIVESYRDDFYTRNIQNPNAKEWVLATIEGIVRELQQRVDYCEGKL